jgi:hypothetical protein
MFDVIKIIYLLLFLVFTSCGPKYDTKYYKAISLNKQDTALLELTTSGRGFYGNYQIKYKDSTIDDGAIVGNIIGDTLLGKYTYLSRGNARIIDPVVFLKTKDKLKLGTGTAGTYMGFHVYSRGSISFNDSLFQFEPIEPKEFKSHKKIP